MGLLVTICLMDSYDNFCFSFCMILDPFLANISAILRILFVMKYWMGRALTVVETLGEIKEGMKTLLKLLTQSSNDGMAFDSGFNR